MARVLNRLSDVAVRAKKRPGYVGDGGNLYLRVAPGGTKGWTFPLHHGRQNTRRWAGLLPCCEPRQGRGRRRRGAGDWRRKAAPGSEHGPRGRVRDPARKILREATVFRDFQEGTGCGKDRAVGDAPRSMLFIEELRELLLRNWGPPT